MKKDRIAIFASGSGTNAENIILHFSNHPQTEVVLVLCNNATAGVIDRCRRLQIPCVLFNRNDLYKGPAVNDALVEYQVTFIVLAGFLWLLPATLVKAFTGKIVNIHPALLPKYGGKGMYGDKVHKAVLENLETVSGITIHYVNELYDEGDIIFQAECPVDPVKDSYEEVAARVHALEYKYYPQIIEEILNKNK